MNSKEAYLNHNGTLYVRSKAIVLKGIISESTLNNAQYYKRKGWNIIVDPEDKRRRLIEYDCLALKKYHQKITVEFGDPYTKTKEPILPLDAYSKKEIELAMARYNLVRQYRLVAETATGSKVEAKKEWVNLISLGLMLEKEFETIGGKISFKTMERWDKQMRDGSNTMDDLLPKKREVKVGNELEKHHKDTLKSLYCGQNQLKVSECIRLARKQWSLQGLPMVSEVRCRRYLTDWAHQNASMATFLRKGIKSMRDECLPYIERDENSLQFMDVLVADGHVLNFQIVNPLTGKLCRPTLIAWADMATRMPVGYEIMYTENTRSVLSAFRNACLNAARICGVEGGILPRAVYMDNGKSFKNKFFTAEADLENDLGGLFERLRPFGLEHIAFAKPYNARAKVIERVFKDFAEIERQLPTYIGTDIANKPASHKRNEVWHREQYQKYLDNHGKITLQGSYSIMKNWIEEYNERPSEGKYLKGKSPLQAAYIQIPELNLEQRTLAAEQFDYMLMHTKVSRLTRNGFNVGGVWYYNAAKFANIAKDDTEYIVKYDVLNPEQILVFHEDGTLWCKAGQWIGQNVHGMAALGSEADREKLQQANRAMSAIEREVLKAAKSGNLGLGETLELPEHAMETLPEPKKALAEKTSDDDFVTTQDGRKIKLKYF